MYMKKPIPIDAWQIDLLELDPTLDGAYPLWVKDAYDSGNIYISRGDKLCLAIKTLEGTMFASDGDYLIRGVKGELYSCKKDIFEETYEECDEKIRLVSWTENEDGSGNLVLDLSYDYLEAFAKIGLLHTLRKAAGILEE